MNLHRSRLTLSALGTCLMLIFIVWRVVVLFVSAPLLISPETTVVTSPIKPDGTIDIAAAMHQRFSAGIHPDTNAAVLIDRAFGPSQIPADLRAQYFEWLGIEPLAEQGDYVVTQTEFIKQKLAGATDEFDLQEAMSKQFGRAQSEPWKAESYPQVAEWLAKNAAPLELIEQASRRPQFYMPIVTNETMLTALTNTQNLREATRLLATRAMLRLGTGDEAGAWSDLMACHRLSQLVALHPQNTITLLIGAAIDAVASVGDAALIAQGMSAEQARACLAEHSQLAPFDPLIRTLDQGERLAGVDAIIVQMSSTGLNVNRMLRRYNTTYDAIIAALKHETYAERERALSAIEAELNKRIATAKHPLRMFAKVMINSRNAISESVADVLLNLLMPSSGMMNVSQTRTQVRRDQVRIGFALAAYRAEHGDYPEALDLLVPDYLAEIPLDRFTEKPLHYQPNNEGFLIYSCGSNGGDDKGDKGRDVIFEVPPRWER